MIRNWNSGGEDAVTERVVSATGSRVWNTLMTNRRKNVPRNMYLATTRSWHQDRFIATCAARWAMSDRPEKITFAEMRNISMRGLLILRSDGAIGFLGPRPDRTAFRASRDQKDRRKRPLI